MIKRAIILLLAAWTLAAVAAVRPTLFNRTDTDAMNAWVEAQMSTMTPEQRVAQLIVMAVDPKDDAPTRALVKRYVEENRVGGLIYNACSLHELAATTNYAQKLATVPLLMTIDGEWGLAMRVEGAPTYPRNLVLGAIDDDRLLYQYGREVALSLIHI